MTLIEWRLSSWGQRWGEQDYQAQHPGARDEGGGCQENCGVMETEEVLFSLEEMLLNIGARR